ncbi:hypothetical protein WMF37_01400 [Sorangium sp. So ce291]|uniref:hypothetical protein n=1 Tax=Sorangium sp. So ce291 TaxID=3133294 RepID=UPI003F5D98E6
MTVEQIVAAIRALPVPDRLRVIELVAHEAAGDVPAADQAAPTSPRIEIPPDSAEITL